MRYKFRGLPLNGDGKYVYGSLIVCGKDRYIVPDTPIFIDTIFGSLEVDPATVGQYIGVEDIHNIEIYDGDKCVIPDSGSDIKYVVEYYKPTCGFRLVAYINGKRWQDDRSPMNHNLSEWADTYDLEIIEDEASHDDKRKGD